MKIFCAQIVDEPENAPTLLLAKSEAELLAKVKNELIYVEGMGNAATLDDAADAYDAYNSERAERYAGLFWQEKDL